MIFFENVMHLKNLTNQYIFGLGIQLPTRIPIITICDSK